VRRPPHAPWHDGPPRFAVGLKPIPPERWLTPDTEAHALDEKRRLLAEPDRVYRCAPESDPAAREAAAMVHAVAGGDNGADAPLLSAAAHVSDDLIVMIPGTDGQWRAGALALCAPTFFSLERASGESLHGLHGPVPGGDGLARRIARIFDNLPADAVLERFNWTLQAGAERFLPHAAPMRAVAGATPDDAAAEVLHVRVERQTIRRLPETGAVLFTIRICLDPVCALDESDRQAVAAAWRGAGEDARAYKGWDRIDRLAQAWFTAG
jgi:hypothetical protein